MAILMKDNYNRSSYSTLETLMSGELIRKHSIDTRQTYVDTEFDLKVSLGVGLPLLPYKRSGGFSVNGSYLWNGVYEGAINMSPLSLNPLNYNDQRNRALEYFYGNAAKENSFNLGIALAEGKETVSMISSTAARLAGAYRNLRKGNVSGAFSALGISNKKVLPYPVKGLSRRERKYTALDHKRKLKREVKHTTNFQNFAANTWLEIRYGWTPLLYDVHGAAEYVAKLLHQNSVDLRLNGVYKYNGPMTGSSSQYVGSGTETSVHRVDGAFKISNPSLRNTSSLGLTNPALIAWELVPFSFVFDWFLPIGKWLEGFTTLQGLELVHGSRTYFYKHEWELNHKETPWIGPGRPSFGKTYGIDREYMNSVPSMPFPTFSLFSRMNGYRFVDAVSLLKQAFG